MEEQDINWVKPKQFYAELVLVYCRFLKFYSSMDVVRAMADAYRVPCTLVLSLIRVHPYIHRNNDIVIYFYISTHMYSRNT